MMNHVMMRMIIQTYVSDFLLIICVGVASFHRVKGTRNGSFILIFFLVAPVDLELKMIHFKRSGKVRQKESEMIGSKMK